MNSSGQVCWAIVPVKAAGTGKTRLAGVLDMFERQQLILAMLHRVVTVLQKSGCIDRICLLSSSDCGLGSSVFLIRDAGGGLNHALAASMNFPTARPPARVLVIPADLPQLEPTEVVSLANCAPDTIAIAPDRHSTGTNGLSLPFACVGKFHFMFGSDSYAAHRAQAKKLGYETIAVHGRGISRDVDVSADLEELMLISPKHWIGGPQP